MSKLHKTQKVQKKTDKSLEKKYQLANATVETKKPKKMTLSKEEKPVDKDAPVNFNVEPTVEEKQGTDKKNRRLSKETSKKGSSRAKVQPKKSSGGTKDKGNIIKTPKKAKVKKDLKRK
jgi:hypothetical protein